MEAIKTYYRAQRPADFDANLWDNAIDLLLADNPNAREVGRTILEANGADMFVADCYYTWKFKHNSPSLLSSSTPFFTNKNCSLCAFLLQEVIVVYRNNTEILNIYFYDEKPKNSIETVIRNIISSLSKIKSALGLQ